MLTFSIVWVILAAAVPLAAMTRKTRAVPESGAVPSRESGKAIAVLAVVYGLTLLAGFIYVGRFLVSSL